MRSHNFLIAGLIVGFFPMVGCGPGDWHPNVAMRLGKKVAVWVHTAPVTGRQRIHLFQSPPVDIASPVKELTITSGQIGNPSVALCGSSETLLIWNQGRHLLGRFLDADLNPIGVSNFFVGTIDPSNPTAYEYDIAYDPSSHRVLVVWRSGMFSPGERTAYRFVNCYSHLPEGTNNNGTLLTSNGRHELFPSIVATKWNNALFAVAWNEHEGPRPGVKVGLVNGAGELISSAHVSSASGQVEIAFDGARIFVVFAQDFGMHTELQGAFVEIADEIALNEGPSFMIDSDVWGILPISVVYNNEHGRYELAFNRGSLGSRTRLYHVHLDKMDGSQLGPPRLIDPSETHERATGLDSDDETWLMYQIGYAGASARVGVDVQD